MLAVPLAGLTLTVKTVPSVRPSIASVAVSLPVRVVSSSPEPVRSPPITAGSSTWLTVTVTVAVSVTPPEVTV